MKIAGLISKYFMLHLMTSKPGTDGWFVLDIHPIDHVLQVRLFEWSTNVFLDNPDHLALDWT